jgi:hypothetical protein
MKTSQNEEIKIDGFTEKEVDAVIRKKKRSIERLSGKIDDLRSMICSESNMLALWLDLKRKFNKKAKGKGK